MASTSNDSFDVSPWLQLLEKEISAEERQKEVRQLIQQALSRLTLNSPEQPKATPPPLMSGGHPVVRWDQPYLTYFQPPTSPSLPPLGASPPTLGGGHGFGGGGFGRGRGAEQWRGTGRGDLLQQWMAGGLGAGRGASDGANYRGGAAGAGRAAFLQQFLPQLLGVPTAAESGDVPLAMVSDANQLPADLPHLNDEQKTQFMRDGYILIAGAVQPGMVRTALRAINASIGKGFTPTKLTSCPELVIQPVIMRLLYASPAIGYALSLLGKAHICHVGQIALRFPGHGCLGQELQARLQDNPVVKSVLSMLTGQLSQGKGGPDQETDVPLPIPGWEKGWHIDGVSTPELRNFSLLIGVCLSDVSCQDAGNLTVYPGSHIAIQDYALRNGGSSSLLGIDLPLKVSVQPAAQLTTKPGDVVLLHYQLAHSIAPNTTPNIRYMIYFRLHALAHAPNTARPESVENIWIDYLGLKPPDHSLD